MGSGLQRNNPSDIPEEVFVWLRNVFADCDARVTAKLSNIPNVPEASLDMTWIEHLTQFSSPVRLSSGWIIKIETHFLGGLRHFHRWEIADIGILLFVRRGGRIERSKVALLQSKRLYPTNSLVREEHVVDYEIGFSRLADPEDLARSMNFQSDFEFTEECRYGAIVSGSTQVRAIQEYERANAISVHYQLYNPWVLPFRQRVPLERYAPPAGDLALGARIVPASAMHEFLDSQADGYRPTLKDIRSFAPHHDNLGWPVGHFVADLFVSCREGTRFANHDSGKINNLFYRRSGPIAAAISITIEEASLSE